ncbi:unnamed protein product [Bursaphelenchus okinawaensis]|uniref:Chitin-binding type-2 domain-containing protein n=1 Tax=Bursaphelenchus okinawaensis TaxID=465554 RepID=A0A811JRA8_9BILA|nr:unnamed protein product [Bursaphelenchus okinawaensis]CAG9079312.1 unnamed protein product [Bursaphelenchus okinawaensis]
MKVLLLLLATVVIPTLSAGSEKWILRRDLLELCSYNLRHNLHPDLQLGQCNPYFLRCESDDKTGNIRVRLGSCANGRVFLGNKCTKIEKMGNACFDVAVNLVNAASTKLAQVVGFCERNAPQTAAVFVGKFKECSRQAMLCIPNGEIPAIPFACPEGHTIDIHTLSCVPTKDNCPKTVSNNVFYPVLATLNRRWCRDNRKDKNDDSYDPHDGVEPDSLRCRNWFVTCGRDSQKFSFCSSGSIFDKSTKRCRTVRDEDQCHVQYDCLNHSWKNIAFDKCQSDFAYCRGFIPIEYQCPHDSVLGRDGECVAKDYVRECRPDVSWDCENGEVYDRNGELCPEKPAPAPQCVDGETLAVNGSCSLFKRCDYGHFELRKCPYGSGFHPRVKECETTYKCPENDGPYIYNPVPEPPRPTQPPFEPLPPQNPKPYPHYPEEPFPPQPHWSPDQACREDPGPAGYHRDPLNCAKFYQCASGRWVQQNCAPGTVFNPSGPYCDHIGTVPGC